MRRFLRRAFSGAAVVSALLFLAMAMLWVRSYVNADYLYYTVEKREHPETYGLVTRRGIIQIDNFTDGGPHQYFIEAPGWTSGRSGPWDWGSIRLGDRERMGILEDVFELQNRGGVGFRVAPSTFAGFGYGTRTYPWSGMYGSRDGHLWRPPDGFCRFATVPVAFLFLLTSILPLRSIVRFIRRRLRGRSGRCAFCGYDLCATPDRCPECGAVPMGSATK